MPQRSRRRILQASLLAAGLLAAAVVLAPTPARAAGLSVQGTPLRGAVVPDGSTVRLAAPGAISVSWVLDGVYLGRDTSAPFELVLSTRPGEHKMKARSETRTGREATYEVRFRTVAARPAARPAADRPRPSATTGPPAAPSPTAPARVRPPASTSPTAPAPTTPTTSAPQRSHPTSAPPPPPPAASASEHLPVPSGQVVRVAGAEGLRTALSGAVPGQVIEMADGDYRGQFTIERSGTEAAPVVLRGGRGAVLDGGAADSGYALHLEGADHWRLEGFTVRGGQKGVVLDEADHVLLARLDVGHTGMEAVHFRTSSSDNRLVGSSVHDTGLVEPGFGEGVYIGSAESHWDEYGERGGPDRSDRNVIDGNRIHAVTAENIDVKEGTSGGIISGNALDGAGMTGDHFADSWIDLKGNGYRVTGNTGVHTLLDGFQTHVQLDGWGRDNVFRGNHLAIAGEGLGVNVHRGDESTGNEVGCDNVVTGTRAELTNVPCG